MPPALFIESFFEAGKIHKLGRNGGNQMFAISALCTVVHKAIVQSELHQGGKAFVIFFKSNQRPFYAIRESALRGFL